MKVEKISKARVHTRYTLEDKSQVPGVTTILGVLAKPALIPWANKLGLQGIEVGKYVDALAEVGTIAHLLILCHLKEEEPDLLEYAPALVDKAENCLLSYFEWEKQHKVEPLLCEKPLVSNSLRFGGTPDFFGKVDGIFTLLDFKTGKGIYEEYFYQLAAYKYLIECCAEIDGALPPERAIILQIGRDETEGFSTKEIKTLDKEWQIFQHCLAIYNLKRKT